MTQGSRRHLSTLLRSLFSRSPRASPSAETLPKGWLTPEEDGFVPSRELWLDPRASISHYYRWVWEYLAYLQLLCDLRRESAVLELGCSHGRTAHGLLQYLRHPGLYRGLDVDGARLHEAQARIQRGHPNFEFIRADVYNRHYNPHGPTLAASYAFPFADQTFDVIYAASLFTHLLPDEVSNYLRQSGRVLKAGGRCLLSFFLLDAYRGRGTTISPDYEFAHPLPGFAGVAARDLRFPDHLIAYSRAQVEERARAAGLRVLRVIPGLWSNSPGWAVNEQDLILLGKEA